MLKTKHISFIDCLSFSQILGVFSDKGKLIFKRAWFHTNTDLDTKDFLFIYNQALKDNQIINPIPKELYSKIKAQLVAEAI